MRFWTLLIALLAALSLTACPPDLRSGDNDGDDDDAAGDDDDDATDDDDDGGADAIVLELYPEPDDEDVSVEVELLVAFDQPPGEFLWTLAGPGGEVPLEISASTDEVTFIGELDAPLLNGVEYRVGLAWGANDFQYAFTTIEAADPDEMEQTIGAVYVASLLDGEFVEPAGAGPIIQAQLDDIPLMMTVREETSFEDGDQPAFHMLGALGHPVDGGGFEQEPCGTSIGMTAGDDGVVGTDDDLPGMFAAGSFLVGPTSMSVSAQGATIPLQEVVIGGTFPPSLVEINTMSIEGIADTRPLDPLLGNDEGGTCQLLADVVGINCFECGEPAPGAFCIFVAIEELTAPLEGDAELVERTCADVITQYETTGACGPEALAYDPDNNGAYALCPAYSE